MLKKAFYQNSNNLTEGQKINLKEKWECDYWSNRLHTTPSTLEKAIKKVGNNLINVKKELEK